MGSSAPRKLETSDYSPMMEQQAKYNRGDVTAQGMGSRQTTPEGDTAFSFDPSVSDTDALSKAMYEKQMSLLQPGFEQQESRMFQRLANQGLPQGGEAYNEELGQFRTSRDTAMSNVARDAVMGGEQARGSRMAQAMQLMGYSPTPIDVLGSAALGQKAIDTEAKAASNAKGGMGELASTAMLMCSKTFKENYEESGQVLEKLEELPVEKWNYIGQETKHISPYAEDFKRIFGVGDGKTISVIDAFGVALGAIKELNDKVERLNG